MGSPSAQGNPPPPPTQTQKSATQPTQDCPLKAHKPCDVDKLVLEAEGIDAEEGKSPVKRKLETTRIRRYEKVTDVRSREVKRLLATYDLIIDVIADPLNAKSGGTAAKVEGKGYYHGRECPTQSHALLTLKPLGLAPELKGKTEIIKKQPGASMVAMPSTSFYAKRSFIDYAPTRDKAKTPFDSVTSVFGIIKALWDSFDEKGIELRADACGVRAKEDTKAATRTMLGLVRIYRRSKFSVGIKVPPLGSFKAEKEASVDVRGLEHSSSSREMSGGFNYYKDERKSEVSGSGALANYSHTGQTQRGGDVRAYEQSRSVENGSVTHGFKEQYSGRDGRAMGNTDGTITNQDIKDRLSRAHGFEIVIAHNDTEVEALDALKQLKEMVNKIVKAVTDVKALFDKVPQVGWKFTFDVSVFTGNIIFEWWPDYVKNKLANDRYWPVQWQLKGSIKIEIINIELTVSFGVDARALDSGLVVKVEGTIGLKASLSKDINMDFFKPKQVLGVEADADAKLAVVGYVSLLGKTLADAELSASGGLKLKGDLTLEWATRTCDLKGKLESKPIELNGYIRVPWWFDKRIDPPVTLLKGKPLYTFT